MERSGAALISNELREQRWSAVEQRSHHTIYESREGAQRSSAPQHTICERRWSEEKQATAGGDDDRQVATQQRVVELKDKRQQRSRGLQSYAESCKVYRRSSRVRAEQQRAAELWRVPNKVQQSALFRALRAEHQGEAAAELPREVGLQA